MSHVHGHNEVSVPSVHMPVAGKSAGEVIDVPIGGNQIFSPQGKSQRPHSGPRG